MSGDVFAKSLIYKKHKRFSPMHTHAHVGDADEFVEADSIPLR